MSNIDAVERQELLNNLKKSVELWFLTGQNGICDITYPCVEILQHGLLSETNFSKEKIQHNHANELESTIITKLMDDFEWLRRSAQIRDLIPETVTATTTTSAHDQSSTTSTSLSSSSSLSSYILTCNKSVQPTSNRLQTTNSFQSSQQRQQVQQFLQSWILRNLKSNCLCACLQTLVSDTEILNYYYKEQSFMRSERHATALFICLSALELNQYSLLSQIVPELYCQMENSINASITKHRRSNSQPNYIINPDEKTLTKRIENDKGGMEIKPSLKTASPECPLIKPVFIGFRKARSLPLIANITSHHEAESQRPRSKTLSSAMAKLQRTQPKNISKSRYLLPSSSQPEQQSASNTSSSYNSSDDMLLLQPSTSAAHNRQSQPPPTNSATSSTSGSVSSMRSKTVTPNCRIELINCDNIKIWTDRSWEKRQQQPKQDVTATAEVTQSCAIPQNVMAPAIEAKSVSPINSFLCHLFSTPPTYSSWLNSDDKDTRTTDTMHHTNADSNYPCNASLHHNIDISSATGSYPHAGGGGVFDAFLPIYGKKLRKRQSKSLFDENGISSLDYSSSAVTKSNASLNLDTSARAQATNFNAQRDDRLPPPPPPAAAKNCQSLTTFLQMAQLSRNNTELEKENAHFRISEAIISAIEHIKWSKLEPDKWRRQNDKELTTATDWLENEPKACQSDTVQQTSTGSEDVSEHIPYAELDESSLDQLSAEVVGLSLISKFNDKHLPKVSELKWLVSEEDTPQQLLPMPDCSPTANPDENVVPSVTRGTRYWAPPRQQIIFTDHPQLSRKQLIQKQKNRCAGCGMRVCAQYMHSFRYCTYLGKYFCTGCHRNQISAIPAKILQMWDFKCYPVSVFSYRLLEQMYMYPLFYVPDLNPALYVRSKELLTGRKMRIQLKFIRDFIKTCRFAVREQKYFNSIPEHITDDPDMWSMSDFIDVHNKSMQYSIDALIEKCENHIFNCVLCTARGFYCEHCGREQVIYPWQKKTFRCDLCGSCYHTSCWKAMYETCSRCQRINKRQEGELI